MNDTKHSHGSCLTTLTPYISIGISISIGIGIGISISISINDNDDDDNTLLLAARTSAAVSHNSLKMY